MSLKLCSIWQAATYKEKTSHVRRRPVVITKEGLAMHRTAVIAAMGAANGAKLMYLGMSHHSFDCFNFEQQPTLGEHGSIVLFKHGNTVVLFSSMPGCWDMCPGHAIMHIWQDYQQN